MGKDCFTITYDQKKRCPPENIGDEMGSSHMYLVIGDYSRTGRTTGGQQSVQIGGIGKDLL